MSFTYTNYAGVTAQRDLTPHRLWYGATAHHPVAQWLLEATAHDRDGQLRDFALQGFVWDELLAHRDTRLNEAWSAKEAGEDHAMQEELERCLCGEEPLWLLRETAEHTHRLRVATRWVGGAFVLGLLFAAVCG